MGIETDKETHMVRRMTSLCHVLGCNYGGLKGDPTLPRIGLSQALTRIP